MIVAMNGLSLTKSSIQICIFVVLFSFLYIAKLLAVSMLPSAAHAKPCEVCWLVVCSITFRYLHMYILFIYIV